MPRRAVEPSVRFWSKVRETARCWIWSGHRYRNGYGGFLYEGRDQKAHRVAWQLMRGPIPPYALVLHACDTKACVRPDHLFLGNAADNTADMVKKGRGRSPGPIRPIQGDLHPNVRLTEAKVRLIRAERQEGMMLSEIAARYGVHIMTISDCLRGKTWRHL